MNIGAMQERVTIQRKTETNPTGGERVVTWATLATVWASVVPLTTQDEALRASAVTPTATYRVEMRYRVDLTTADRISWRPFRSTTARVLEISGIGLAGRDLLRLDCVEATT